MGRFLTLLFFVLICVFLLFIGIWYIGSIAQKTKAAANTLTLTLKAQGNYQNLDQIKADIDFYTGPNRVHSEVNTVFTYQNDVFTGTLLFPAGFHFDEKYGLFIKPHKYSGRLFCNEQLTGPHCKTPLFAFSETGTEANISSVLFFIGDIPPVDGKIDAQDLSRVMKNLGKTGQEDSTTDVNGDNITDVTDYSLVLYSLTQNIKDDVIDLTAPAISPSPQPQTPTLQKTPTPAIRPSARPTPSPTLKPTTTPKPSITPKPTKKPKPTKTPIPTKAPTPTNQPTPTITSTPAPTQIPRLGKNCTNGSQKVTKSINPAWKLNVLPPSYGYKEYRCVFANNIVLHWSDSPNFTGNSATWGALNSRNRLCGLAVDDKEVWQMSNFYDDKVTWEGCSTLDDAINIEINGTQFDLWYNTACQIVNPASNPALAVGELQKKKEEIAKQYGLTSTSSLDWENARYITIMKAQEEKVLNAVRFLQNYYDIPLDKITGHTVLTPSNSDPGKRFLECIKKKI